VNQQQSAENVSIDDIPIDIATTIIRTRRTRRCPRRNRVDYPWARERAATDESAARQLKAARWWYIHGTGGTDPAFQWAIEWARHLATDTPSDVDRFDDFLDYLVTVGFADEKTSLR